MPGRRYKRSPGSELVLTADYNQIGKKDIAKAMAYLRPSYHAPEECDFPTEFTFLRKTRTKGPQAGTTYGIRVPVKRCGAKALVHITIDGNIARRCPTHGHQTDNP